MKAPHSRHGRCLSTLDSGISKPLVIGHPSTTSLRRNLLKSNLESAYSDSVPLSRNTSMNEIAIESNKIQALLFKEKSKYQNMSGMMNSYSRLLQPSQS